MSYNLLRILDTEIMNPLDVLKKIIESHGNCDDMNPSNCKQCPLSNLIKDNTKVGCVEGIGIENMSKKEADKKYLEAAKSKLLDIEIEEALKDEDVAK